MIVWTIIKALQEDRSIHEPILRIKRMSAHVESWHLITEHGRKSQNSFAQNRILLESTLTPYAQLAALRFGGSCAV
jgi:hypothetical protein